MNSSLNRMSPAGLSAVIATLAVCAMAVDQEHREKDRSRDLLSAASYRSWSPVNKKPHFVPGYLSYFCRPVLPTDKKDPSPHANKFVRVYVNAAGEEAMSSKEAMKYPVGTVIVKEKLSSAEIKHPELLTVMVKREKGYNPKHGDWEYGVFDGAGKKVQARGKLKNCQSCHQKQAKQDYVFRTYLTNDDRKAYSQLTASSLLAARR